jgi:hypothetical protein
MDREWVTNVSVVLPDLNFAQGPAGRRGAGTHSMAPSISAPHWGQDSPPPHWGQDGVICARASQRRSRCHDNNDHSTIASAPAPRRKPHRGDQPVAARHQRDITGLGGQQDVVSRLAVTK